MAAAVIIEPYVEENERRWYRSYITLLGVNEPMNMFQKERQIAFADRFRKTNDATTKLQYSVEFGPQTIAQNPKGYGR